MNGKSKIKKMENTRDYVAMGAGVSASRTNSDDIVGIRDDPDYGVYGYYLGRILIIKSPLAPLSKGGK
jgi:hypothetical protein